MVGVSSGVRLRQLGTLFDRGTIGGKTDAELLDLFAQGDAAEMAFETLVARHGPDVLRACRRILSDPNDADDAFQATFLVLARRASSGSIGRPESLGPWLYGAALRVARKARVAAARRRRHEQRVAARLDADSASRNDLADCAPRRGRPAAGTAADPRRPLLPRGDDLSGRRPSARCLGGHDPRPPGQGAGPVALAPRPDTRTSRRTVRPPGAARRACRRPWPPRPIRAARTFAPGGADMPGLSAAVAELMEGVLTMTIVTRWIIGSRDRGGTLSRRGRGRRDGREGR